MILKDKGNIEYGNYGTYRFKCPFCKRYVDPQQTECECGAKFSMRKYEVTNDYKL